MTSDPYVPRIVFAGDRGISVRVLDFILSQGVKPLALILPELGKGTHSEELVSRCNHLDEDLIIRGGWFREPPGLDLLRSLNLDYIICIHSPYIIPRAVLEIPKVGVTNLHPAWLPYNRGWHTPTWAILDKTPYGATLHFMNEALDAGDIIHQRKIDISPEETAHSSYARVMELEYEVFREAWPALLTLAPPRKRQDPKSGTFHRRKDLLTPDVQEIKLDEMVRAEELIQRLRALTTNRIDEAAYMAVEGRRYRIQVQITPEV